MKSLSIYLVKVIANGKAFYRNTDIHTDIQTEEKLYVTTYQ